MEQNNKILRLSLKGRDPSSADGALDDSAETLDSEFETSQGTLAKEASSDIVQAELASMREAAKDTDDLSSSLEEIAREYDGVELSGHTPASALNEVISRLPKTKEVKG